MTKPEIFDLQEPKIPKEEILGVKDKYFHPKNVAIVTGAASGIGRATAIALSVSGLTVIGTDIDEKGGQQTTKLAKELGGKVIFIKTDLTKDEEFEHCIRQTSQYGNIKFLTNIAGIQHIDSIENFPMQIYDLMQKIMLRAPFFLSKLCIPHMRASEDGTGAIGNMSSIHGHIVTRNKPV